MRAGGRECNLPESWFSPFSFFFFFYFLSLSFAKESLLERVRGTRNVSCVYQCGYFSVIDKCYINVTCSLIAVTIYREILVTVCCEMLEEGERRGKERKRDRTYHREHLNEYIENVHFF